MKTIGLPLMLIAISLQLSPELFAQTKDKERSIAAFMEASKVFKHPRCLNCHPAADYPTQGDDLHRHIMNVQRGADDHGVVAMRCETCHREANYVYSEVPGAPKWALAPRSMAWQGLSDRDLCKAIKDPKKNHGMTTKQLIEHNAKDPLVAWAWNPGADREPAPGTQEEFGKHVEEWLENGAACPGD